MAMGRPGSESPRGSAPTLGRLEGGSNRQLSLLSVRPQEKASFDTRSKPTTAHADRTIIADHARGQAKLSARGLVPAGRPKKTGHTSCTTEVFEQSYIMPSSFQQANPSILTPPATVRFPHKCRRTLAYTKPGLQSLLRLSLPTTFNSPCWYYKS